MFPIQTIDFSRISSRLKGMGGFCKEILSAGGGYYAYTQKVACIKRGVPFCGSWFKKAVPIFSSMAFLFFCCFVVQNNLGF